MTTRVFIGPPGTELDWDNWGKPITDIVNEHDGRIAAVEAAIISFYGESAPSTTSGTDVTSSATFVNCAGTGNKASFSFTKTIANTRVLLECGASFYTTAATGGAEFALRLNGTDYTCTHENSSGIGVATKVDGWAIASGIPVGVYTVQARWRRYTGTGVCTRGIDQWMSISAREIN